MHKTWGQWTTVPLLLPNNSKHNVTCPKWVREAAGNLTKPADTKSRMEPLDQTTIYCLPTLSSLSFTCCQSWVLFTDYLSKTLSDWETEGNSSEAYHLSWRNVDDSEITRCQPQEAGPEEWPPAQLNMCLHVQSAVRLGAGGGAGTVLCILPRGMKKAA